MTTSYGQPLTKPEQRLASRLRTLEERVSRILTGAQVGSFSGGSDPSAVHVGDAAGEDVGGTFPTSLTVPGLTGKQPLDSDLTAIALLSTTSFGRALLTLVDAAAGRTAFGAAAAVHSHAEADITGLVTDLAGKQPLDSDLTALAALSTTAYGRSVLEATNAAALRTLAGLVIGTDVAAQGDSRFPTANEKAALAGTDGSPSATDKFVTDSDGRLNATQLTLPQAILALKPELYWDLGANGATDLSGNSRNGTGQGGVTLGGAASLTSDGGASTDFDGTNDYITSGYNPFAVGSVRTFIGFVNRDNKSAAHTLAAGGAASNYPRINFVSGLDQIEFKADDSGTAYTRATGGSASSAGRVLFWALVFDDANNKVEFFVDALSTEAGLGPQSYATAYNATPGNFQFGARGSGASFLDGRASHVAVFSKALSRETLAWLFRTAAGHSKDWGLVSALPTGALPGDTCTYIADSTNGIFWNLIYDGQGTYPWKGTGCTPLSSEVDTPQTRTGATTYGDLTTAGPSITAPLAGVYELEYGADMQNNSVGFAAIASPKIGTAATADADWVIVTQPAGVNIEETSPSRRRKKTLALSDVVKLQYRVTNAGSTGTFGNRFLKAAPVMVA